MTTYAPSLPKTQTRIQWTTVGNPADVLHLNDSAPVPTVSGSQVLIKVHAVALNPIDTKLMQGFPVRLTMPSVKVPGLDIAGTVVGVGVKASSRFQVGDKVMVMLDLHKSGGLTEYTVAEASLLVKKPERWSFEQAAAWPLVAHTVWQALVVKGKIKRGDKVLINGASGGTGTVGVQMAKALGAYVVGVCSTANVQLVKDLGADEVVDYKTTNVTERYRSQDFDIVFDTVDTAAEIWANNKTLMKPTGNLVRIAGSHQQDEQKLSTLLRDGVEIMMNKLISLLKRGPGYHFIFVMADGESVGNAVRTLDQVAKANPVIDSVNEFTLPSVIAAYDKSLTGRAKGKIVIRVAPATAAL
ncbi:NADPh quinone reductase [Mortierella alpina]|nr:NADPh quinone reductase [Mortierella alpina]